MSARFQIGKTKPSGARRRKGRERVKQVPKVSHEGIKDTKEEGSRVVTD